MGKEQGIVPIKILSAKVPELANYTNPLSIQETADPCAKAMKLEKEKKGFEIYLTIALTSHLEKGTLEDLTANACKFMDGLFVDYNLNNKTNLKLASFLKNLSKVKAKKEEETKELLINSFEKTITAPFVRKLDDIFPTENDRTIIESCLKLKEEKGYDLPKVLNEVCRHFSIDKTYSFEK